MYYPERQDDADDNNFYVNLYRSMVADLRAMIDPSKEAEAEEIRKMARMYFNEISKPKLFANTPDGFIISMERAFEELCAVLEDNGTHNPRGLTVYEFMARAAYCERKFKHKNQNAQT